MGQLRFGVPLVGRGGPIFEGGKDGKLMGAEAALEATGKGAARTIVRAFVVQVKTSPFDLLPLYLPDDVQEERLDLRRFPRDLSGCDPF